MSPSHGQGLEWRFGDRDEGVEAWLRHSAQLHMVVHFRPPEGPENQWHSIMTVTPEWLREHAKGHNGAAGIWPALLIVPEGSRKQVEETITRELRLGWQLIVHNATPTNGVPRLPEPDDL